MMYKEDFDGALLSLSQINEAINGAKNNLKLLGSKKPDSSIAFRFSCGANKLDRKIESSKARHLIDDLINRKEMIIESLEKEFADANKNIRRFDTGKTDFKMTNPTTKVVFLVTPADERTALYYILLLEKRIALDIPVCLSDYKEMESYFKKSKSSYPKELFNI